jgi:uncharacterized protein YbaR (Trm112 family)
MLSFDPAELLPILCCPVSRRPLRLDGEDWLVSTDADTRLRFPIQDGIPVLLEEEAETLSPEAWKEVMDRTADQPWAAQETSDA